MKVQDGRVRTRLLRLSLVVALLGAGCSAGHGAAIRGAVTGPAACDLITARDAARLLGAPVEPNLDAHVPRWNCIYQAANTSLSLTSSAMSLQLDTATSTGLARMFRALRNGTERVRVVVVPPATTPRTTRLRWQVVAGVGDEALWDSQGLQVRSGDRLLEISVEIRGMPDLGRSVAAARLALQRLSRA